MKIRSGFVSNSSSSSFIIISKNGELTKEKLLKAVGADKLEKDSVLYKLGVQLSSDLMNCKEMTPDEYKDEFVYRDCTDEEFAEENPQVYKIYNSAKTNNWKIYYGFADSVDEPMLCELDIYYEDDNIKIEKDGGY